ncbi:hypothetical protein D3C78_1095470 [compost metagenome]
MNDVGCLVSSIQLRINISVANVANIFLVLALYSQHLAKQRINQLFACCVFRLKARVKFSRQQARIYSGSYLLRTLRSKRAACNFKLA